MAGPDGGVKAEAMTLATQPEPATSSRASLTWTWPRGPLIVSPPTVSAWVPRLPPLVGTVIERKPPVTVTVAALIPDVAADACEDRPNVIIPAAMTTITMRFLTMTAPAILNAVQSANPPLLRRSRWQPEATFAPRASKTLEAPVKRLTTITGVESSQRQRVERPYLPQLRMPISPE